MGEDTHDSPFEFSGGELCLDFVNTLGDRPRCANENLHRYEDLLAWGAEAGTLNAAGREELARRAAREPRRAAAALRRALDLREALFRVFAALADGATVADADLAAVNRRLPSLLARLQLAGHGGEPLCWTWAGPADAWARVLAPVARSAADLLTSGEVPQLRECASETCSWLFVDRSRTHRRRWCDMKTCGNRAKARRHYRRTKQAHGGSRKSSC
jgi:predicted RNA-binding Zn ribbon-like protein